MNPFLGQISIFGCNYAPLGWALCEGQVLPINQYTALFSLLGINFGGNGTTNFQLPDLRSRAPLGFGQSPGLSNYTIGESGGAETVTINAASYPLLALKARGLAGVELVVSDDHPGLKQAIREVLPEAAWQRCYVHFLRNALDYVPRKVDDDCLQELRWFYDRRDLVEVRRDIAAWLGKWQAKYPRLCNWVEDNIEETLTYYRLPLPHHKHMKSTNMLERLNQELKRRTHVVRIFPNAESCLRLVRALAVEMHENWLEAMRYLNMDHLKEHKKEALRALAA